MLAKTLLLLWINEKKQLNQSELAEILGVSQSTINNIIRDLTKNEKSLQFMGKKLRDFFWTFDFPKLIELNYKEVNKELINDFALEKPFFEEICLNKFENIDFSYIEYWKTVIDNDFPFLFYLIFVLNPRLTEKHTKLFLNYFKKFALNLEELFKRLPKNNSFFLGLIKKGIKDENKDIFYLVLDYYYNSTIIKEDLFQRIVFNENKENKAFGYMAYYNLEKLLKEDYNKIKNLEFEELDKRLRKTSAIYVQILKQVILQESEKVIDIQPFKLK